jgi:hypothetical protein
MQEARAAAGDMVAKSCLPAKPALEPYRIE